MVFYITPTVTVKNNSNTAIYVKLGLRLIICNRVVAKGDQPIP